MSALFTLKQSQPFIYSNDIVAITGEKIILSGLEFKNSIDRVYCQSIYDANINFTVAGESKKNINGLDNTLYQDIVGLEIPTGIAKTKYRLYVYNTAGESTNSIELHVLDSPSISSIEINESLPDQFVRLTGNNLYPYPKVSFISRGDIKTEILTQSTGVYRITGYEMENFGTGYKVGEQFLVDQQYNKLYSSDKIGILEVSTTGVSGSLATFNIINSGLFTIVSEETLSFNSISGREASVNILYDRYNDPNLPEFVEFQVPRNVTKAQKILVENLKYKVGNDIFYYWSGFKNSGESTIDFNVLGVPKIHSVYPLTGYNAESIITISGDNLNYVTGVDFGKLKNIIFSYDLPILSFKIPYIGETDKVKVVSNYGEDLSEQNINVSFRPLQPTGYYPNDILLTGTRVYISGKNLQRINYINLGQQNITRDKITVDYLYGETHQAYFSVPDSYKNTELKIYSLDFPNSGILIESSGTENKLIASTALNIDLINIKYLSGIQAAKYLDEVEIYTPSGSSGDYGNLTNSEVFFTTITGNINLKDAYNVSGIKILNSPTGIKFLIPKEIKNPRSPIKIRRNKFGEEYILPLNKSFDILPTITYVSPSNTNYASMGALIISGINASSANQAFFSGYDGTTNVFGFKQIKNTEAEILEKNISGILKPQNQQTYTEFEVALGGDIVGSGEVFLFHDYYDTGIGYENEIITKDRNIRIAPISGFRPVNSPIFTSPGYIYGPIDTPFIYTIQTNSKATQFELFPTTISGINGPDAIFPPGLQPTVNSANQIVGIPTSGGIYYIKIRAIDGDYPDEAMILNLALGYSGRSLVGPGIIFRGDWDSGIAYAGDSLRRDIVKYTNGANYWYAANTNINSIPSPNNPDWIPFTNEMSAAATQLFLAERSNITNELNIGKFGILSGYIKSVNDVDVNDGSGFYLGYDHKYNIEKPVFRVGNKDNYIKFDGFGLDIIGPLSGVVTTSKDIKASDNRVSSRFSVALGQGNTIADLSDNALAFGTNNIVSGAIRATVLGGSNNLIKKVTAFNSYDSIIAGGTNNLVIGSYSCIGGGRGNTIDSSQSGLASIAGQVFINLITGSVSGVSGTQLIRSPARLFTDRYSLINSIETLDAKTNYRITNIKQVADSGYQIDFNTGISGFIQPEKINLHSWSSITADNVFIDSFNNEITNPVCEFKVARTGIEDGDFDYNILFRQPMSSNITQDNIVAILNVFSTGVNGQVIDNYNIYNLSRTGINIRFPFVLNEDYWVNMFIGETGVFTGIRNNLGKTLEIGKKKYFENSNPGVGTYFPINNLNITGNIFTGLIFTNVNQNTSDNFYLSNVITNNNNQRLAVNLSRSIHPVDQYLTMDYLGYTGIVNTPNLKAFRATINSGNLRGSALLGFETPTRRYITLPSPFSGTSLTNSNFDYSIFINTADLVDSSGQYYSYTISSKEFGRFWIEFSKPLQDDLQVHVLTINTGIYDYDGMMYNSATQIISGYDLEDSNIHFLQYPYGTQKPELIFTSFDNVKNVLQENSFNFYNPIINDTYSTGFEIKLSKHLRAGESARINILTISKTGFGAASMATRATLFDESTIFTGAFKINLSTGFTSPYEYRVFSRVFADQNKPNFDGSFNNIPVIIKDTEDSYFRIKPTENLLMTDLVDLTIDYMVTDLDFDKNIEYIDLVDYAYSRLAVPFDDAGSNMIAGGTGNLIKGVVSAIAGGTRNSIYGDFNTIMGGRSNTIIDFIPAEDNYSRVIFCNTIGGLNNTITGNVQYSTILGGSGNLLSNDSLTRLIGSSILGGTNNYIGGAYSLCAGNYIHVLNRGTVFFADSSTGLKRSTIDNAFILNFDNGIYITGVGSGKTPMVFDVNSVPNWNGNSSPAPVPIGGLYRNNADLHIRVS